jgi:DNA-binding response OmpR family regulator
MSRDYKILVVDDEPLVLDATALALRRAGYTVEVTQDVFCLPLRVGQFRPDAVLLDVDLPAMTGDKLARSLHGLRVMKECKVIFHSARSEAALASAAADGRAAGYIRKGLPRADFLARLRELLEPEAS